MPRGVYDRTKNKSTPAAKPAKAKTAKRGAAKASGSPALDKARTRIANLGKRIVSIRSTAKDAKADASTKFKELKSTSRVKIKAGNAAIRALPRLAKTAAKLVKAIDAAIAKTKTKVKAKKVEATAPAAPKAPRAAKSPKAPRASKAKTAPAVNPTAAALIAKGGASAAQPTVPATGADATVSSPAANTAAPAAQV